MKEFEEIRSMWLELNSRITSLEEENRKLAREITGNKYKAAKDKLSSKYKWFIGFEFVLLVYMILFFATSPNLVEAYRPVATLYWIVFLLIEIVIDIFLLNNVNKIDVYNSSITDIRKQAARNWKLHKLAIAIGLPVAFGAIILFALAVDLNKFTILGMAFGFLIGLAIGGRQLIKFRKYYKLFQTTDYESY